MRRELARSLHDAPRAVAARKSPRDGFELLDRSANLGQRDERLSVRGRFFGARYGSPRSAAKFPLDEAPKVGRHRDSAHERGLAEAKPLVVIDGDLQLTSQRGSHRQYTHSTKPGKVTVAGASNKDVPKGTAGNILRQAGLRGPRR